jgi:hypothetical protein
MPDHPLSRPFEPAAPLFLLFLQKIISDRLRKPAETLAARARRPKKTARKQRRQGKTVNIGERPLAIATGSSIVLTQI